MNWTGARPLLTPRTVMAVLICALLVLVFSTFRRYGFTTDEIHGLQRANAILEFLSSWGAQRNEVGKFVKINFYGAMPDVIARVLQKALPGLALDSRHLVPALFGVIGIYYAYLMGGLLGNRWTGPIAALLLSFNPMWSGYMFINVKDIPFATALLAASYHALTALDDEHPPGWLSWLGLTLWSGLLATTKLLGLPMLGVVVFILVAALIVERRRFDVRKIAGRTLAVAAAGILGSLLCAALFWPQLFLYSPTRVLQVFRTFMDYPWRGEVMLNGVIYPPNQVPRYYVLTYIVISMPLFLQALFLAAAPVAWLSGRLRVLGLVAIPVAFLMVQAVTHSQEYNGYRHFLFIIPWMAIAAAFPLSTIACGAYSKRVKIFAAGALIAFMGASSLDMLKLFPYQYSSYNILVGGVKGAEGRYYIDVWRSALREALGLFDAATAPGQVYKVYSCGSSMNFYDQTRFTPVKKPKQADFIVALPYGCQASKFTGYRTEAEVRRENVLFATVLTPP